MNSIEPRPQDTNMIRKKDQVSSLLCNTFLFFIHTTGLFVGRNFGSRVQNRRYRKFLEVFISVMANLTMLAYNILLTTNYWRSDNLIKKDLIKCIGFQTFMGGSFLFSITMSYRLCNVLVCFGKGLEAYEKDFYFCPKTVSFAKRMKQMKFLIPTFILAMIVSFNLILYNYISISKLFFPTYNLSKVWSTVIVIFCIVSQAITATQLQTSLLFYVSLSYCAVAEFNGLSKQIEESIKGIGSELKTTIEFFYHKHEVICQLIDEADQCFRPYLLLLFVIHLPASCIFLYAFVMESTVTTENITLLLLTIWSSLGGIFLILFTGGLVSSKASDVTGHLWKIKPSALSERDLLTLSLFATKRCGQSVGFSVYGLFTINFPAILSIFGTVVAYFIVIIQMKPSDPGESQVCNCTVPL